MHHARRKRTPFNSNVFFDDGKDVSYRRRSRTLPSESFSYDVERHNKCRYKSSPRKGLGNDVMSKTLNQISKSPFAHKIEGVRLPRRLNQLTFTIYNGRTDLVEHVRHFNQRMTVHSKNKTLMCKVFPSSLGPVVIRWFNDLGAGSISSFKGLTQAFGSRFITCSRVPRTLDSLHSLSM